MTRLRALLLVILALLLPVRGVLAGVSHCGTGAAMASMAPGGTGHDQGQGQGQGHGHGHGHDHHHGPAHADAALHAQADDAAAGPLPDGSSDGAPADTTGSCKLCASSCSGTAFLQPPVTLTGPFAVADLRFPSLKFTPTSHPPDGLERPPRSA